MRLRFGIAGEDCLAGIRLVICLESDCVLLIGYSNLAGKRLFAFLVVQRNLRPRDGSPGAEMGKQAVPELEEVDAEALEGAVDDDHFIAYIALRQGTGRPGLSRSPQLHPALQGLVSRGRQLGRIVHVAVLSRGKLLARGTLDCQRPRQ